jgi:PAS domain S-box-containing protein
MAEHLGRTVAEMIPELFPTVEPYIRRALKGEVISGVEITKPASGVSESKTILLSYEPARDEAGEVIGVSVALVDVTPIKRAEEARFESEEHFRYMMELMPQIPWIIDDEGRALDVSQRWLEITGMTEDQWRGFGWLDALHPDDRQPTRDAMQKSFETGRPIDVEYRLRRSEGDAWKRMRSRGSPRIGRDGKITCWYGCLETIDEDS